MYYIVNVQFWVDFIGLVDYNILNKGAVSQMKPDRRQNKCYKNKRLTLPEQGRLSSIAAYRNNKNKIFSYYIVNVPFFLCRPVSAGSFQGTWMSEVEREVLGWIR